MHASDDILRPHSIYGSPYPADQTECPKEDVLKLIHFDEATYREGISHYTKLGRTCLSAMGQLISGDEGTLCRRSNKWYTSWLVGAIFVHSTCGDGTTKTLSIDQANHFKNMGLLAQQYPLLVGSQANSSESSYVCYYTSQVEKGFNLSTVLALEGAGFYDKQTKEGDPPEASSSSVEAAYSPPRLEM